MLTVSVTIVSSDGALFEENYGVSVSSPTTSHSRYRIASVAKMFAVVEVVSLIRVYRLAFYQGTIPLTNIFPDSKIAQVGLTHLHSMCTYSEDASIALFQLTVRNSS